MIILPILFLGLFFGVTAANVEQAKDQKPVIEHVSPAFPAQAGR